MSFIYLPNINIFPTRTLFLDKQYPNLIIKTALNYRNIFRASIECLNIKAHIGKINHYFYL